MIPVADPAVMDVIGFIDLAQLTSKNGEVKMLHRTSIFLFLLIFLVPFDLSF